MKKITKITEEMFRLLVRVVGPQFSNRAFRILRFPLPYRFAKNLNYDGLVHFSVNDVELVMRSYNTPIEITIFWKGLFAGREGTELRVWSEIVREGDMVLDIGANTGVYSLVASTVPGVSVFAFEPVPSVRNMMEENVRLSRRDNVFVRPEIISDEVGEMVLYVPGDEKWVDFASVEQSFVTERSEKQIRKIRCATTSVDEFMSSEQCMEGGRVVCKIDVEGAEARVLKGMSETLRHSEVVALVEILNESSFKKCLASLPLNYACYPITSEGPGSKSTTQHQSGVKNYLIKQMTVS